MSRTILLATAFGLIAAPGFASSTAMCDQAMMLGPDQASPALLASCAPYFQSLADNAASPGTFSTPTPTPMPIQPVISTQGTGG